MPEAEEVLQVGLGALGERPQGARVQVRAVEEDGELGPEALERYAVEERDCYEGIDGDGTVYRLVTDGEDDPLLAAREGPDGWQVVGEVVGVEAADRAGEE